MTSSRIGTILTDTRGVAHLESISTSTLERPSGIHAQLIAAMLTSAFVDISAPRAIALFVPEAFPARAHNCAILGVANLLAAAIVTGTGIYRVTRFIPQLVTNRTIASIRTELIHAFVRTTAVIIFALVHVETGSLIFLQVETLGTLATVTPFHVYAIIRASSVFHLALVDIQTSLGIRQQLKATGTLAGEASLQVNTDVRTTTVFYQTLVHVAALLPSLVQTQSDRTTTSDTSNDVETRVRTAAIVRFAFVDVHAASRIIR